MRVVRLLSLLLLCSVPVLAQTTTSVQGDPQAIAIVQASITALGGATAIGQAHSWTFRAQSQGSHANGQVEYVISTHTDTGNFVLANGKTELAPRIHSHFVPALVGAILLKESQDPQFSILYAGTSIIGSKPVSVVVFASSLTKLPAQIWCFDATAMPVQVDFRLPAQIGARESFPIVVALSDYRAVSGVLHPFSITSFLPGKPPEILTLSSVAPASASPPNDFNGPGGDLR
jgi:hypothetical protein